jgi:hypothetical protein
MSIHEPHEILLGYNPLSIWHSGCQECESRGADPANNLGTLDADRFARAWHRSAAWNGVAAFRDEELGEISEAEGPLLNLLWRLQVALERNCGLPIGELPYTGGRRD